MRDELTDVYQEAIALTDQQAQAIANEDWELLNSLLLKRDRCIARAEALLHDHGTPANREELHALLVALTQKDEANQAAFQKRMAELKQELSSLTHRSDALVSYYDSMRDVPTSSFFDHDQ